MKLLLVSVIGLVAVCSAAELGLEGLKPSELKEIQKEIAAGNVPPNYTAEKLKRGLTKLTNTDSPSFNYLSNPTKTYTNPQQGSYTVQPSFTAPQQTVQYTAPQQNAAYPNQQSLRLLYGNQYYPANQYLSYLQNPQVASQLAAQYAYPQAVPHYVQTPTQIQYVSPPNYQGVPSAQFKALTSKSPVASASAQTSQAGAQATSQVVLPSNMAAAHQYQQPQILMYLISPHQQQALLAQQQSLLYPGHQMVLLNSGNPLLNLYNSPHRFGLSYSPAAASGQLSYVPGAEQQQQYQTLQPQQQYQALQSQQQYQALQSQQQYQALQSQQPYQTLQPAVQETNSDNSAPKAINVQETSASTSFGVRTKA